jgi:putative ATP-dependent endonuclease of OLD family
LSGALYKANPTIPDLAADERVAFVVMGGSTLVQWVSQYYLKGLGRKELHIYDEDVPAYEIAQAEVNGRNDGSCTRGASRA